MTAPAHDTAWWSFVEVMAADTYRLGELPTDEMAVVVDLGANLGDFSVAVVERFAGVRVLAFEPSPGAYRQLQANLVTNGLERVIHAQCCAVVGSVALNEVMLWEQPSASTRSSLLAARVAEEGTPATCVRVAAVPLADVLTSLAVPVDLLKVDVEGAEYEIFAETPVSALANVRRAVVEYHPVGGHGYPEVVDAFRRAGFRWLRHERASFPPGFGLLWFERVPTGCGEMRA
ncbi:MAG: FkbM family methyltransferase [Candidatus Dormibacteria bacterium]